MATKRTTERSHFALEALPGGGVRIVRRPGAKRGRPRLKSTKKARTELLRLLWSTGREAQAWAQRAGTAALARKAREQKSQERHLQLARAVAELRASGVKVGAAVDLVAGEKGESAATVERAYYRYRPIFRTHQSAGKRR